MKPLWFCIFLATRWFYFNHEEQADGEEEFIYPFFFFVFLRALRGYETESAKAQKLVKFHKRIEAQAGGFPRLSRTASERPGLPRQQRV
ncbi:MAG: hypothetical protein WCA08_21995 [Desulfoferrobacter sp.]